MTKEEKKEYFRKYYLDNREKILESWRKNRESNIIKNKNYRKTINGFFSEVYGQQRSSSKVRNHPMPNYTKQKLQNEFQDKDHFRGLWDRWVREGYNKEYKPSFDRIDASKSYTLFNLQVMTWGENRKKGNLEGPKKPVKQYSLCGKYIKDYLSIKEASITTGIDRGDIGSCCLGKRKTAGKHIWKFKI